MFICCSDSQNGPNGKQDRLLTLKRSPTNVVRFILAQLPGKSCRSFEAVPKAIDLIAATPLIPRVLARSAKEMICDVVTVLASASLATGFIQKNSRCTGHVQRIHSFGHWNRHCVIASLQHWRRNACSLAAKNDTAIASEMSLR